MSARSTLLSEAASRVSFFQVSESCHGLVHAASGKIVRVSIMVVLTLATAVVEIVCGIRSHSQSLVADGLYSFAEGLCLIGVIFVLRYSQAERKRQTHNTFGHERLELLFGLIQEVFLLSISLGIIVDAVNHLVNPIHVHDPNLMIALGLTGIFVGLLGMVMFWGYHHDHNIQEEIEQKKKGAFLAWSQKHTRSKRKLPVASHSNESRETALVTETMAETGKFIGTEQAAPALEAFTYENVDIREARIYATLHALCLHSFVRIRLCHARSSIATDCSNFRLGCTSRVRDRSLVGTDDSIHSTCRSAHWQRDQRLAEIHRSVTDTDHGRHYRHSCLSGDILYQ